MTFCENIVLAKISILGEHIIKFLQTPPQVMSMILDTTRWLYEDIICYWVILYLRLYFSHYALYVGCRSLHWNELFVLLDQTSFNFFCQNSWITTRMYCWIFKYKQFQFLKKPKTKRPQIIGNLGMQFISCSFIREVPYIDSRFLCAVRSSSTQCRVVRIA